MKTTIFNIILLLFCLGAKAQQTGDTTATAGTPNIWLTNSNKAVVKEKGITVDRAFFTADKVYIGSNTQAFKKGDKYNILVWGEKSSTHFSQESPLLTEAIKREILSKPAGTRIVFSRGNGKKASSLIVFLQ
jgi:hypothetical protein